MSNEPNRTIYDELKELRPILSQMPDLEVGCWTVGTLNYDMECQLSSDRDCYPWVNRDDALAIIAYLASQFLISSEEIGESVKLLTDKLDSFASQEADHEQ